MLRLIDRRSCRQPHPCEVVKQPPRPPTGQVLLASSLWTGADESLESFPDRAGHSRLDLPALPFPQKGSLLTHVALTLGSRMGEEGQHVSYTPCGVNAI